MPKRVHLYRPDLAQAVASALESCQDVKDHQRLLAMRMAASGQFTAAQIAEQLEISRRQFFNWITLLKNGGVAGLLERKHGGGTQPSVQGKILEEFQEGLRKGRWKRAKEIQRWLSSQHKVKLALPGVYYWLKKIGRGLEGAAQDPRQKRRGSRGRIPADALRKADALERGWWKAGSRLGGR